MARGGGVADSGGQRRRLGDHLRQLMVQRAGCDDLWRLGVVYGGLGTLAICDLR